MITSLSSPRLFTVALLLAALPSAVPGQTTTKAIVPTAPIVLFNGKDLTNFYTYLVDHKHQDPDRVFTVVDQIDGAPAIRSSGQHYGGLITKESYANYRLITEFRWGDVTWAPRKDKTRDSGILLHCQGPDGNSKADFNGPWMRSIEFQIIEGGTGDILLVGGYDKPGGPRITHSMVAPLKAGTPANVRVWDPKGTPTECTGRINWYGRAPDWKDVLGFRGSQDVEKPVGQWSHLEAIVDGNSVVYYVNGVKVNEATRSSLSDGKLLFQSEGAEIFFRKIELHPLKK
jgi:hypothetical protein